MIILYNNNNKNINDASKYYYFWVLDYNNNYAYFSNSILYILMNNYCISVKNLFSYILTIFKLKKTIIKFLDILKFHKQYLINTTLTLKLIGLGYKVITYNNNPILYIGLSHRISLKLPKGVECREVSMDGTCFTISSYNKVLLTDIVSKIKHIKKLDPYKGSGIRLLSDIFLPKSYKK